MNPTLEPDTEDRGADWHDLPFLVAGYLHQLRHPPAADPTHAVSVETAHYYRVSLSEFTAWPIHDQAAAMAAMLHARGEPDKCGRCGTVPDDWPSRPGDPTRWAAVQHECPGCRAIAAEEADIPEGDRPYTTVRLIPAAVAAAWDAEADAIFHQP